MKNKMNEEINTNVETNAELDMFTINAKSSVKLIKNSRGINWEIKIVTGEADLIEELMQKAISCHNKLKAEVEDGKPSKA